jgi:hypothetical protein
MTPTQPAWESAFIQLWQQGASYRDLAQAMGCPLGTVASRSAALATQGKIQPRPRGGAYASQRALAQQEAGTPEGRPSTPSSPERRHTEAHLGTPAADPTTAHQGTPAVSRRHTRDHSGTPAAQPTAVHQSTPTLPMPQPTMGHPSVPMPEDLAVRILTLLPDLEVIVARERDRQRLLGTPVGTPQHTVKKTYVVDTLYVDLIERYAQAEGLERKDVVNLAFHEFFERRQYLPEETP